MIIHKSGNVGIGTTSPGQTLQVIGTANISQSVTLANIMSDTNN